MAMSLGVGYESVCHKFESPMPFVICSFSKKNFKDTFYQILLNLKFKRWKHFDYNKLLSGRSITTGVPYHLKSVFDILQEKRNNTEFRIAGSLNDEYKIPRRANDLTK